MTKNAFEVEELREGQIWADFVTRDGAKRTYWVPTPPPDVFYCAMAPSGRVPFQSQGQTEPYKECDSRKYRLIRKDLYTAVYVEE